MGRIAYVDGLRALAVLAVLIAHVAEHGHAPRPVYNVVMEGSHGVDLFFVLSGFCLAYPTLMKLQSGSASAFNVADFAAKRLVRIVPPFYIATAALLALAALPSFLHRTQLRADFPGPIDIGKSLLFLDGHANLLNGSFWTLMVEFRWYFVFPILLALWIASPRGFFAVGIGSMILYHLTRAHGLDFGTLPGFMLGIVAADIQLGGRATLGWSTSVRRWALPAALVCAALGIACEGRAWIPGFENADVLWPYQPTILGWQLAMFFFVVAAGAFRHLQGLLAHRVLVATGVASYAIYLVHEPLVDITTQRVGGLPGGVLSVGIALAAGFAFWAVAERPFTTGKLRRPLLAALAPVVSRALRAVGCPTVIPLGRNSQANAPAGDPVTVPPVAVGVS